MLSILKPTLPLNSWNDLSTGDFSIGISRYWTVQNSAYSLHYQMSLQFNGYSRFVQAHYTISVLIMMKRVVVINFYSVDTKLFLSLLKKLKKISQYAELV